MANETRVQILIQQNTQYGEFRDAIYVPMSEYDLMSPGEIEALKQARVQQWLDIMATPAVELTPEEILNQLKDQLKDLDAQRDQVLSQLELMNGE